MSQCEKLGLRPGFVVGLNALKPWNGIAWNLCNPIGGDELMDFLDREDPELVIGRSSCDVSDFLKGSNCALRNQTDFHVCARAYARQHHSARSFCTKHQSDQCRGRTGTSHGSHHFLKFSRSRVQFVGGKFAKKM